MAFIKRADNGDGVCNFDNMGFFAGPTDITPIPSGTGGITVDPLTRVFRDESGSSTSFVVDFTDTVPATLVVRRFVQNDSITINIENANIIFTSAPTALTDDLATLGIVAGASPVWNLQFCSIGTTSGATSGFGTFPNNYNSIADGGRGIRPAGSISNNTFYAANGANGLWFINLAGSDSSLTIAGNTYNQTALHTNVLASFIQDSTFDGATRTLGNGSGYTMRFPRIPGEWTAGLGNRFDGTLYSAGNVVGAAHFNTNYNNDGSLKQYYSVNQLFENTTISFSTGRAGKELTLRDGYTWNPKFRDISDTTIISEVHLVGIPANVLVPLATVDTSAEWVEATDSSLVSPTGYYFHETPITASVLNTSVHATKAIDYDLSVTNNITNEKLIAIAGARHTVRAKGYSHFIDQELATQVDRVDTNDGADATPWVYLEEHTIQAGVDTNLNGRLFADAGTLGGLDDLDDFYPAIKHAWVTNTDNTGLPITQVGARLTFNQETGISTGANNAIILNTDIQVNTDPTGFSSNDVSEMVFTTGGSRYASTSLTPLTLRLDGGGLTIENTAGATAQLTLDAPVGSLVINQINNGSFAGIVLTDNTRIILPSPEAVNQELDLELAWGGLTPGTGNIITAFDGTDPTFNWVITGAPAGLLAGDNTRITSGVSFTGLRGSETAGSTTLSTALQIFAADAEGVVAVDAVDIALSFETDEIAFSDLLPGFVDGETYRYVYTRPGFGHITDFFVLSGDVQIALTPIQTGAAELTVITDQLGATIVPTFVDREFNTRRSVTRIDIGSEYIIDGVDTFGNDWSGIGGPNPATVGDSFFANATATASELAFLGLASLIRQRHMELTISGTNVNTLSETATNNLFELAKTSLGYGIAIAKIGLNNNQQLIAHTSPTQTSLISQRYNLNTGLSGIAQNVTSLQEQNLVGGDGNPDGTFQAPEDITQITGTLDNGDPLSFPSVNVFNPAAGISFGDFQATAIALEDTILDAITDSVPTSVDLTDDASNRDVIINAVRRSGAV